MNIAAQPPRYTCAERGQTGWGVCANIFSDCGFIQLRITPGLATIAILVATIWLSLHNAQAQNTLPTGLPDAATKATSVPNLPDPLTRDAIREVLSKLNDAQTRNLLISELNKKVAAAEAKRAAEKGRSLGQVLAGWASALRVSWVTTFAMTNRIPAALESAFVNFQSKRGDSSLWRVLGALVLCLGAGLAAAFGVKRLLKNRQANLDAQEPTTLWSTMGVVIARFLTQGTMLVAFVIGGYFTNSIVNASHPADTSFINYILQATGWTWLAIMAARFMLSPTRPSLRLCAVDDDTAWFLTRRIGIIFGWSAFSLGSLIWMIGFGFPHGEVRLGFWFSLIFHALIALTIWQARSGIYQMVLGHGDDTPARRWFAELWPVIAIGLVVLQWLVVELFVATGNLASLSTVAMNVTLATVLALPLFELAIRALVEAIWANDPDQEPALQAAHKHTQAGLVRCGRVIMIFAIIAILVKLWGLDLRDLASQGVGAQVAGALMEVFLITVVAYGLWEGLNIVADRQIAIERFNLGLEEDGDDGPAGAEGGKGGSRLGTLMPLIRGTGQVIIILLATLAVLGQLGVNVTPLLAGAGIIGLAVGFGAQTLVKDIISGVFFLVDDAFRTGEYIDIGTVKGVVEKISIRSMQLRHHLGPLNTVPFGEIRHLTNYSRDWVMMKLKLRLTYDTDVEKVRKLVKKLGQQLLEDPAVGDKFLQPLKSQGVIQMDDSAMIVRVKFMTLPGDQFVTRTKVYAAIRELFEREGIKFAHREVTVRIADEDEHEDLTEHQKRAATAAARSVVEAADGPPAKTGQDM